MAQKININRGLGLGMAQLGAFARMGMIMNMNEMKDENAIEQDIIMEISEKASRASDSSQFVVTRKNTMAFEPDIDFDMIDSRKKFQGESRYLHGFSFDDTYDDVSLI
ncbi:unnamed protein product [Caenorhabditis bovis]|uniref:Uncharacterized protein n=1 Tax=Caenorhabditis bovis TaxID=2654633 RepID=A0A8S1EBR9_9PELO|nr:unnamed protein product [Caenorhabditis bovis]